MDQKTNGINHIQKSSAVSKLSVDWKRVFDGFEEISNSRALTEEEARDISELAKKLETIRKCVNYRLSGPTISI